MFQNIEEINNAIGQALYDSVNEDWVEIQMNIKLGIESIGYRATYMATNGEIKQIDFWDNDFGLPNKFKKLHQTMTAQTDKHKWNRAKATLTDDMKLNIQFEWDQELADELERLNKEN